MRIVDALKARSDLAPVHDPASEEQRRENPEAIGPVRELFWPRALKLRSEKIKDGKPY